MPVPVAAAPPAAFVPPETYSAEMKTAILSFFKKRAKAPNSFTFTANGNLEIKEGARVGKKGKIVPAGTVQLRRFVPLDPTEREQLEEWRLDSLAALDDEFEQERLALRGAWEDYKLTGAMRAVLLSNQKLAELDARRNAVRSAVRDILAMPNMATRELLMDQPFEERKLLAAKDPFSSEIVRLAFYPFLQEQEFGKYVDDELLPENGESGPAAGAAAAAPTPSELAVRQKLKDGRMARIFFESSDDVNGFLSPMFPVEFTLEDRKYFTAYQAYEVLRAEELGSAEEGKRLLGTRSTHTMRLITRKMKGHPSDSRGLWLKILTAVYQQQPSLKQKLLNTGTDALVYADVREGPSGIGLADKDRGALDASKWKGENHVGLALETIRTQMREETLTEAPADTAPQKGGVISEEEQEKARVGAIIHARRNAAGAFRRGV